MPVNTVTIRFSKQQAHLVDSFSPWNSLLDDEKELYAEFNRIYKQTVMPESTMFKNYNDDGSVTLVIERKNEPNVLFAETYYLFFGRKLGDKLKKMLENECARLGLDYSICQR